MCDAAACTMIPSEPIAIPQSHNEIEETELQGYLFRPTSKTSSLAAIVL